MALGSQALGSNYCNLSFASFAVYIYHSIYFVCNNFSALASNWYAIFIMLFFLGIRQLFSAVFARHVLPSDFSIECTYCMPAKSFSFLEQQAFIIIITSAIYNLPMYVLKARPILCKCCIVTADVCLSFPSIPHSAMILALLA